MAISQAVKKTRVAVATLTVSAAAVMGIAAHEGYVGHAYRDPVGILTIGYGETAGVKLGDTTTKERALVQLTASANKHAQGMAQCIKVPLYQYEYDAYVDFTYNVGVGAFCKSSLAKKLNAEDYLGACTELLKWVYAKGQILPGLVTRRKKEYETCLGN